MDTGSTIIGVVITVLCLLPFMLMSVNRKRKEKQLLNLFDQASKKQNCTITKHEHCGDFVIGIDENKKGLFFLNYLKTNTDVYFVDLTKIQLCKVVTISRIHKADDIVHQITDRLELKLTPFDKNSPEIKLEFFNSETNVQMYGELQAIEKWNTLVNVLLKTK